MSEVGTVIFFNASKGYGFVKPDADGPDIFLHAKAVDKAWDLATPQAGDRIAFDIEIDTGAGKPRATNLKRVDDSNENS